MRKLLSILLCIPTIAFSFEPEEDGLYAVFDTSMGEFTARLAYTSSPLTVANFVGLAEGTIPTFDAETGEIISTDRFYDGLIFHSVAANFVLQSGDPDPDDDDVNGPGYSIPDEMHPNLTHNAAYRLSMANNYCGSCESTQNPDGLQFWNIGENSGGSQFFITLPPPTGQQPPGFLDGHYSIFGSIIDGQSVVDAIGEVDVDLERAAPLTDVVINTVTIIREGEAANKFYASSFEVPYQLHPTLEANKNTERMAFELETLPATEYQIERSTNLTDWTEEIVVGPGESPSTVAIVPNESGATFMRAAAFKGPINYQKRIPNASFVATLPNAIMGEVWSYQFNDNLDDLTDENAFGILSIDDDPDSLILRYEYHRLPNGFRLRIVSNNFQAATFYGKFTSETEGGVFVWIDDYYNGTAGTPIRYPATGTFRLTQP